MIAFRRRLRRRLLILASVAALPAIGATLYIQSLERTAAHERAVADSLRLVKLAAAEQLDDIQGARRLQLTLLKFGSLQNNGPACTDVLKRVVDDHPSYFNVGVIARDGSITCTAQPVEPGVAAAVKDRPWFIRAVTTGAFTVGEYQTTVKGGVVNPAIVVAQPIKGADGRVTHVIATSLKLDTVTQLVNDTPLPPGATLTLFDRSGTILARAPNGRAWIGKQVPYDDIPRRLEHASTEDIRSDTGVDGVARLYVTVPVGVPSETGMYMGLGVEPRLAFAYVDRTFFRYLALIAFVAIASMVGAITAAQTFVFKPVAALSDTNERTTLELRETEGRYRQLFEQNPHPMWVFDRFTLKFLEVNEAAVKAYGYSRDEFLQMRLTEIRPPEDVPQLQQSLVESVEPWARTDGWRHRLKSGEIINVEISSHMFTFAGRRAELVSAINVTERVRAEAALAERTALTALTADVAVALNLPHDHTQCLLHCAEIVAAHLGANGTEIWSVDDATGRAALSAVVGHAARLPVDAAESAMRERRPSFGAQRIIVPLVIGSRAIGVLAVHQPKRFSDTIALGLSSVAHVLALGIERHLAADERARAQAALTDAEERMRFALEATGVGVWESNLVSGVSYWSPTCEAMHGVAPGEFGRTEAAFLACIHPDDVDEVRRAITEALITHRDVRVEYRTVWPNGTERRISSVGHFSYDAYGVPVRGAGVTLDITERRSLEQQLQQSQKMEAIGQLAGGVAHDFNNLLTAIQGFAGLVADTLDADDPRRGDVDEILRAADRAAALTRQLLAFSRKQILAVRVLHVGDVISDLSPMLRRLIGESIELCTTAVDRRVVKADPGQLQQVILNLAVNARDAMPSGGRLTIETADVMLDEEFARRHPSVIPGPHVRITVTDAGCGMDAATQKRIFEPFFTTKPKDRGTGLGLATVYGIVKQSGGSIWVDSEVGRGTTFRVYLPCTHEAADESVPVKEKRLRGGAEHVLLVEDEDHVRDFVSRVLTRHGYTVHAMPTPRGALEYAGAHPQRIDLVFTDVVLPDMSGRALVGEMHSLHPESKVLYMSGYTDDAIVDDGVLEAGTAFLQKPFTADVLARKVRDVLDA